MIYIVSVTTENIANGNRWNPGECPVNWALSEAIGDDVRVGPWIIETSRGKIPTPAEVCRRIRRYDSTGEMQPFRFTINY